MSADADFRLLWNEVEVSVSSRIIPRYMWTTATIDVAIDGTVVLRTGGVSKSLGGQTAMFMVGGSEHRADLTWGRHSGRSFPFTLKIDGAQVADSRVRIENWWAAYWPWAVALLIVVVLMLRR